MPHVPYYCDAKMTINIQVLKLKVSNLAYVLQHPLLTIRGQITLSLKIHQPTGEIPVFHKECHTIGICHILPTSSLKLDELGFSIGHKKNMQSKIPCWKIHKFLSP